MISSTAIRKRERERERERDGRLDVEGRFCLTGAKSVWIQSPRSTGSSSEWQAGLSNIEFQFVTAKGGSRNHFCCC
jgi:hypothetical protein